MFRRISFRLLSIFLLSAIAVSAQTVYTPAPNAPERKLILDALRAPVEKRLRQKINFKVDQFRVRAGWAFVNGEPQNAAGGQPDYRNTPYRDAIEAGAFDNNFQALLKKTGGKWKVITYAIGCTDVCWLGWDEEYKAPRAIFPLPE